MVAKISQSEYQKLNQLKELDIQQCSFCSKITILNLGWEPFVKLLCQACREEHVICPELCLKVVRKEFDCHLYQELPRVRPVQPIKPNRSYAGANCYLCGKELKGAGKTGVVKNRNNPSFWGINIEYKILCLLCLESKFYSAMSKGKRKTLRKYLGRGYV